MRRPSAFAFLKICATLIIACFILASPSYAQRRGGQSVPPEVAKAQQEAADYDEMVRQQDLDKKIKLATRFLDNYPETQRKELVYNELVSAYYKKQDWTNFYATADKTAGTYPDDVQVLALVGWVIPHSYDPNDPDATKKLDKAESYEKHAIEVIEAMAKPASVTDDQFTAAKAGSLSQAHSGLGLVYFREQDWDNSVKELQQATQTTDSPDATDLFALAFGLERLSRYTDAAAAYDKCGAAPGALQARCKTAADKARSEAGAPK